MKEAVENRSSVEMSASAWTMVRCVAARNLVLHQLLTISLCRMVSQRIVEQGGAALVADYGHQGTDGDTLRAFCRHAQVDPLELPGSADITADVDFSLLKTQISSDCSWYGPVTQVT